MTAKFSSKPLCGLQVRNRRANLQKPQFQSNVDHCTAHSPCPPKSHIVCHCVYIISRAIAPVPAQVAQPNPGGRDPLATLDSCIELSRAAGEMI